MFINPNTPYILVCVGVVGVKGLTCSQKGIIMFLARMRQAVHLSTGDLGKG
jgi:hypothetical protein